MTGDLLGGQQIAVLSRRPLPPAPTETIYWLNAVTEAVTDQHLEPVAYAALVLTPLHASGHPTEMVTVGLEVVARCVVSALAAAAVIGGDTAEHVCSIEWRAPIVCGQDGLLVEVHEVTATSSTGPVMNLRHLLVPVTPATVALLSDDVDDPTIAAVSERAAWFLPR